MLDNASSTSNKHGFGGNVPPTTLSEYHPPPSPSLSSYLHIPETGDADDTSFSTLDSSDRDNTTMGGVPTHSRRHSQTHGRRESTEYPRIDMEVETRKSVNTPLPRFASPAESIVSGGAKSLNKNSTAPTTAHSSVDDDEESRSDNESSKALLTEQIVTTGEEDEETIHQVRGKLYGLQGYQWKEKGVGTLRLNVKRDDGTGARLVMRKEAVFTLLLNVTLFSGMRCSLAQDPRYLRFSVTENGSTVQYNLKVSNAKIAQELLEEINANIPPA